MQIDYLKKGIIWQDQDLGGKRKGKTVCIQRYGGFGDMMQISSLFPGLKDQGYQVTVNTTPKGYEIIRNDPHVDAFYLQDDDQVPNPELGWYWEKLAKCFDKFIMLSESVEGSLIALPDRRESAWHPDFRRLVMGTVDYLEATHAIAEVPLPPKIKFYPNKKEQKWADDYRASLGVKSPVIMWVMSGSSVHKTWPYIDLIFSRILMTFTNVKVITVGDDICKLLESGWEREKRIIKKCGKWSIRQTLTMAQKCDMVIGPETGVLNSVAMLDMYKMLMLSHSSKKNIGLNWNNTSLITPSNTDCYPCHILHKNFELCKQDEETGAALCAANINPEEVWWRIFDVLELIGGKKDEQHLLKFMPEIQKAGGDIRNGALYCS